MIEMFARLQAEGDVNELHSDGVRAARSNPAAGIELLSAALLHTHAREESYSRVTTQLAQLLAKQGEARSALSLAWYSGSRGAQEVFLDQVPAIDRARTFVWWAESEDDEHEDDDPEQLYRRAARELEETGKLARAAICYERAGDVQAACALWSRLAMMLESEQTEPYAAGLARFNQARMCHQLGDERAAREATISAVHRLEEAADRFESIGQRERAFDCFHVLMVIGQLSGELEHVLEGCVNQIRILQEDNLRFHALRLYRHAMRLAEGADEYAAAATLAREMTAYARKHGLLDLATHSTLRQAELWEQAAERTLARDGPPQLAENALLASLLASAEVQQYARVGATYRRLGELELEQARLSHYGRAAERYEGARNVSVEGPRATEELGEHVAPPDVWHVDLLEWQENGNAAEACADVILDPESQEDPITRRSALIGRLVALAAEDAPRETNRQAQVTLAEYLAPVGLYGLIAPLEALYQSRHSAVRLAAIRALSRYFYKRTFVTLETALQDPEPSVVSAAAEAVERLHFDHAFDPLARIYRTATDPRARIAALRALARIDVVEAAELLLATLDHGGPAERKAALSALRQARGERFPRVARAAYPEASERLKEAIEDVFDSRRIAL